MVHNTSLWKNFQIMSHLPTTWAEAEKVQQQFMQTVNELLLAQTRVEADRAAIIIESLLPAMIEARNLAGIEVIHRMYDCSSMIDATTTHDAPAFNSLTKYNY